MVSLTDTEQVAVFQAAAPLPVARRSEFISAVLPTSSSIIDPPDLSRHAVGKYD